MDGTLGREESGTTKDTEDVEGLTRRNTMNLLDMTADLNELAKNAGHVSEHAIERNRRASAMAVADLSKVLAKQALSPMMAEAGESSTDMEDMFAKIQADAEKRFHHHPAPLPSTRSQIRYASFPLQTRSLPSF